MRSFLNNAGPEQLPILLSLRMAHDNNSPRGFGQIDESLEDALA